MLVPKKPKKVYIFYLIVKETKGKKEKRKKYVEKEQGGEQGEGQGLGRTIPSFQGSPAPQKVQNPMDSYIFGPGRNA